MTSLAQLECDGDGRFPTVAARRSDAATFGGVAPLPAFDARRRAAVARLGDRPDNLTGVTPTEVRAAIGRAWALLLRRRAREAQAVASRLELRLGDLPSAEAGAVAAELSVIRAAVCVHSGHERAALSQAALLARHPPGPVARIAGAVGRLAAWRLGDLEAFYAVPVLPALEAPDRAALAATMLDRALDAAVELQQLRLPAADRLAQDALDLARRPRAFRPAAAFAAALRAQVTYEAGDLEGARGLLREHLAVIRTGASPEAAIIAYPMLARIATYGAQGELAALLLREGEQLGERTACPGLTAACLRQRLEILLAEGRHEDAQATLERLDRLAASPAAAGPEHAFEASLVLARASFALARAPRGEDVAAIRRLHHQAIARQDLNAALQLSLRMVHGLTRIGQETAAGALLVECLDLALGAGLFQTILDSGEGVRERLEALFDSASAPGSPTRHLAPYAASLIRHWDAADAGRRGLKGALRSKGPLTQRERDILRLFSRGLSNKHVALHLRITAETVKSHAKNIFVKLAAQTRVEAVSRAESLGLI